MSRCPLKGKVMGQNPDDEDTEHQDGPDSETGEADTLEKYPEGLND